MTTKSIQQLAKASKARDCKRGRGRQIVINYGENKQSYRLNPADAPLKQAADLAAELEERRLERELDPLAD